MTAEKTPRNKSEIKPFPVVETSEGYLPAIHQKVFYTEKGTSYLKGPGVVMIATPKIDTRQMRGFLEGFPEDYKFLNYLEDPTPLSPAEELCKVAGQTCYMSFGLGRTTNEKALSYFVNIIESGHGSVLEHANFSFLFYGISRSITHELVRHRAGMGYSQVSQRYVSGKVLRFVERPEYQDDEWLHRKFESRIDFLAQEYEEVTEYLYQKQLKGDPIVSAEAKTDRRKKVQQAARSGLPNEAEAPIIVTGNVRAWRHVTNMRANEHAEIEIRRLSFEIFRCLKTVAPILFYDFETVHLPDGTHAVKTQYPKV